MADNFAAQGYLTVVPDLYHRDWIVPEDFFAGKVDTQRWLADHGTETVDPAADFIIGHLRNTLRIKTVAGVGYCFGAKVSLRNLPIMIMSDD